VLGWASGSSEGTGCCIRPPNPRVNAPHSAVTARAYCGTRLARGRAGYRCRYTDGLVAHLATGVLVVGCAVMSGCGAEPRVAQYSVPSGDVTLAVSLLSTHPFLAEFKRELLVTRANTPPTTTELFPDTGGYALVNLYRRSDGQLLVRTIGDDSYVVDPTGEIKTIPAIGASSTDAYLGAFDWDAQKRWRFIPASEAAEMPLDQPHTRR